MLAPVDVTNIRIETERLILRPWRESDLSDLHEYARMDAVGPMAGWAPHKSIEESRAILSMFICERKTLALELKANGKVIGSIGLEELSPDLTSADIYGREIGYAMSKDYWGRGLMPEAVSGVIRYCFEILNYDYLTCGHFDWNNQSRRVVEKTGFHFVMNSNYTTQIGTDQVSKMYILYNPNREVKNV